jgi:hypothetical protein
VTSLRGSVFSQREKKALLRPHTEVAAYEFYLRGRQCFSLRSEADLKRGAEMFEQAIELDSKYSPAYAGLAVTHAMLYEWFGAKQDHLLAAQRASQTGTCAQPEPCGSPKRVFGRGWGHRSWIEHDPDYDSLRDDLRFQDLLANVK